LNLRIQDGKTTSIVFGESRALLLHDRIAFGAPLEAVENKVPIVKRHEEVARLDSVPGAHGSRLNESFEWRDNSALYFRLEDRSGSDAMLCLGKGHKQTERNDADSAQFQARPPRSKQSREGIAQTIDNAARKQPMGMALQVHNWSEQRRNGFGELQCLSIESSIAMPFECYCPDHSAFAVGKSHRHERGGRRSYSLSESLVGNRNPA
jgi:hypothetical protein